MDDWMFEEWVDRWMDRITGGRLDGYLVGGMNVRMNGPLNCCVGERLGGGISRCLNQKMGGC